MNAVITGATGLVGSLVIQKLLKNSQISKVISVSRRPVQIQDAKLVQILIPDLIQIQNKKDQLQGDLYFCCLGTTIKDAGSQENFRKVDFDAVVEFGKIAKEFQAKSFVMISAMGAEATSSIFYNRIKGETEKALQALNIQSLSIFRPGLLIGDRLRPRRGEKLAIRIVQALSPLLPTRLDKTIATPADRLADRMIESALAANKGVTIIKAPNI